MIVDVRKMKFRSTVCCLIFSGSDIFLSISNISVLSLRCDVRTHFTAVRTVYLCHTSVGFQFLLYTLQILINGKEKL